MKIKSIITAALALIMATGCNGQNKNYAETFQETSLQNEQTSNSKKMNKSIVIFFSHAGDNYSVGVIDTGNTKIVRGGQLFRRRHRHGQHQDRGRLHQ